MSDFKKNLKIVESKRKMLICSECGCKTSNGKCKKCKKVMEDADFDYKKPKLNKFGNNYDAMSLQGRADLKQRVTNARYGDNPLEEDEMNEDHQTMLDRLHSILNRQGVQDQDILNGVDISEQGKQKIAGNLGISAKEVQTLLFSLQASMSKDSKKDNLIQEDDSETEEYSYETDGLGSITVRNDTTNQSVFIEGSEAAELADQIEENEDDPEKLKDILKSAFENNHKDIFEGLFMDLDEEDNFDKEINVDSGTYNMPWELDGEEGTMTVFYSVEDDKPVLKIESVRNEDGDEIDFDEDDEELLKQAKDFIGKE